MNETTAVTSGKSLSSGRLNSPPPIVTLRSNADGGGGVWSDKFKVYCYRFAGDHPHAGEVCYVGTTQRSLKLRHKDHRHLDLEIDQFMRDYPHHVSGIEHLASAFNGQSMLDTEKQLADYYDCWSPKGFNCAAGGVFHREMRQRMSASSKNKPKSKKHRDNISKSKQGAKNPMYGKRHPDWLIRKIAASNSGSNHKQFIVMPMDKLLELAKQGMSVTAIAATLGVSWSTVKRRLRRSGYKSPSRKLPVSVGGILQMRDRGISVKSIAGCLGVSPQTIRRRLEESR